MTTTVPDAIQEVRPTSVPATRMAVRGATFKVARYEMSNIARSRWLLAYMLFFIIATDALIRFGNDGGRALLSMVSVVLFVVPLVSLVFGATYLYDAREFTELLLAQPVSRGGIFAGLYLGLALPLSAALVIGIGLPFAWHGLASSGLLFTLLVLLACGATLTLAFVALAFLVAIKSEDRVRGLGLAIGIWLALTVLYDGLVLVGIAMFSNYPIERPVLALMLANPVDLARVLLLVRFDSGALQGYTGAVFNQFFGGVGVAISVAMLFLWVAIPVILGLRAFRRRDF